MLLFYVIIKIGKRNGKRFILAILNIKSEICFIIKSYIDK